MPYFEIWSQSITEGIQLESLKQANYICTTISQNIKILEDFPLQCQKEMTTTSYVLTYRKISNIRRTKYQNLNGSRLMLQLPLTNPLKPGVKSRMKM